MSFRARACVRELLGLVKAQEAILEAVREGKRPAGWATDAMEGREKVLAEARFVVSGRGPRGGQGQGHPPTRSWKSGEEVKS